MKTGCSLLGGRSVLCIDCIRVDRPVSGTGVYKLDRTQVSLICASDYKCSARAEWAGLYEIASNR